LSVFGGGVTFYFILYVLVGMQSHFIMVLISIHPMGNVPEYSSGI
jgi:hypothetical protein